MKYVLAGDIGGTRARFALFAVSGTPRLVHQDVLESRSHKTFPSALAAFLDRLEERPKIAAATFGIAGPVVDQRVKTTNLPWAIDGRHIARTFSITKVTLLNDLVAVGLGAIATPARKLAVVHRARPSRAGGNLAVIAAGTGLGEATFIWDGEEHVACATEGSHASFAPQDEVQDQLLAKLRSDLGGHVSFERVASGSTIATLYRFFVEDRRVRESKANLRFVDTAEDANVAVVELAEARRSEAAMQALELWCHVYGAEAGNLALKSLATGGVYVCGGVSARLAKILAEGLRGPSPFVRGFVEKGRLRPILEDIPVAVCLEPAAGLLGAATHAASSA